MDLLLHVEVLIGVSTLSILAWPRVTTLTCDSPLYKVLVALILCSSWLFACSASIMSVIQASEATCRGAVYMCAWFYGLSKFFVYLFLAERLHLITIKGPRRENPLYVCSVIMLIPFIGVMTLIMLYHNSMVDEDGCHLGLTWEAAIPLAVYDTSFGIFQMGMFAFIMCRYIHRSAGSNDAQAALLRKALKLTFLGSIVAFILSFFNIMTLVSGRLHVDFCLFLCIVDVLGSAFVITYLIRPIGTTPSTTLSKPAVRVATSRATRADDDYEQELQAVAAMLQRIQGQTKQREVAVGLPSVTETALSSSSDPKDNAANERLIDLESRS